MSWKKQLIRIYQSNGNDLNLTSKIPSDNLKVKRSHEVKCYANKSKNKPTFASANLKMIGNDPTQNTSSANTITFTDTPTYDITIPMSPTLYKDNMNARYIHIDTTGQLKNSNFMKYVHHESSNIFSYETELIVAQPIDPPQHNIRTNSSNCAKKVTTITACPESPSPINPACKRLIGTKTNIRNNVQHEQNANGLYECNFCRKTFKGRYPFRAHVKTHTGDAPTCHMCNKSFPKKHNLEMHMRTHTGEKPFKCDVCGRYFSDKSNLKVHMNIHNEARPFKCGFCSIRFVTSSRLQVHEMMHKGGQQFHCILCNNSFYTKNQLNYHSRKQHNQNANL